MLNNLKKRLKRKLIKFIVILYRANDFLHAYFEKYKPLFLRGVEYIRIPFNYVGEKIFGPSYISDDEAVRILEEQTKMYELCYGEGDLSCLVPYKDSYYRALLRQCVDSSGLLYFYNLSKKQGLFLNRRKFYKYLRVQRKFHNNSYYATSAEDRCAYDSNSMFRLCFYDIWKKHNG